MMANSAIIHTLNDTSELTEFDRSRGLFLKPIARINISVKLPQIKDPGKSISNWDLMEKLKKMIRPSQFAAIKVSKSTLDFVRFEAELDNRTLMDSVVEILDNAALKIIGFFETLPVKAAEAKLNFPTRHDWDSFFRDAKNMNEIRPGERPDTLHIKGLPIKWFLDPKDSDPKRDKKPSEAIVKRVFMHFGDIRAVDIPMLDPYRREMTGTAGQFSGLKTFSFTQDLTFEVYIQYLEYIGFVKAMDGLRGLKLVHKDQEYSAYEETYQATVVAVDFDRTKHMSDKSMRKRRIEREKLQELERQREEKARKQREAEEQRVLEERLQMEEARLRGEAEKFARRRHREEKRRLRRMERKKREEEQRMDLEIAREERKILVAQRRLESMRLLTELFKRAQLVVQRREVERELEELEEVTRKEAQERVILEREERERKTRLLSKREVELRQRMVNSWNRMQGRRFYVRRGVALRRARGMRMRSSSTGKPFIVPRVYGYRRPLQRGVRGTGTFRNFRGRRFFRGPRWRGNYRGGFKPRQEEPYWSPSSRPPPPGYKESAPEGPSQPHDGHFSEEEGLGAWDDDDAGFEAKAKRPKHDF